MQNIRLSLSEMTGREYCERVAQASSFLGMCGKEELLKLAEAPVDFFPPELEKCLDSLLEKTGSVVSGPFEHSSDGAATNAFRKALKRESAPLSGLGPYRIGEDGRLSLAAKSEHYQLSLGHNFPGYRLLENAKRLGILNATHNTTRGHVTRLLERELVRLANGITAGDEKAVDAVCASQAPHVLNRVINLETGTLACEAAIKMMLARFYRLQPQLEAPVYSGRTPVFLVMQDYRGGLEANYHGTSIFAQMMRGMWGELYEGMERAGLFKVVGVPINDLSGFRAAVDAWDQGAFKVAGFLHELVLMNYGGIELKKEYLQACYQLCDQHDIPCFVDEIQSCMWSPEIFMFKEYGIHPDFLSVGKGFPGGEYPASRMVTTVPMDNLNLFGALVTNGQEELASLSNLITIRFAEANADHTAQIAQAWRQGLDALAQAHPQVLKRIEGRGFLSALVFEDAEKAVQFCHIMTDEHAIDVSAQAYKANCPPAALFKPPLIISRKMVYFMLRAMDESLKVMEK